MRVRRGVLLTVLALAWTAAPAQGQWVATGYLGTNFGDVEKGKGGIGGSVGYFGGRLGFELDLERHWHFFKDSDIGNTGNVFAEDINTRATSFMGNVVVPIRIKGATNWRPYGTGGLGVIRATFQHTEPNTSDVHQNDLAFNVGGGVMYSLNSRVGLRGDLRYFRALADEDKSLPAGQRGDGNGFYRDYGFWRVTFGVTFGFPR
jgi:Outer membrane protein beta-barrel domain